MMRWMDGPVSQGLDHMSELTFSMSHDCHEFQPIDREPDVVPHSMSAWKNTLTQTHTHTHTRTHTHRTT